MAGQRIWAGGRGRTGDHREDHGGSSRHHQAREEEEENRSNLLREPVGDVFLFSE